MDELWAKHSGVFQSRMEEQIDRRALAELKHAIATTPRSSISVNS
jgi:ferredoxin